MATSESLLAALAAINVKPPHEPSTTFSLFSSLPTELRLKIWSFACTPRILPIRHHSSTTATLTFHNRTDRTSKTTTRFSSSAPPPVLLSVCSESRMQALRAYHLTFATKTSEARIYFCPSIDVLYFERYRDMGYDESIRDFRNLVARESTLGNEPEKVKNEIWRQVRYIALDYVDVNIKRPWESYNKACLIRSFPNLEEINLVIRPAQSPGPVVRWLELAPELSSRRMEQSITFTAPKVNAEMLLRWWAGFRHSFAIEERMLENNGVKNGKPYEAFLLPAVKLVTRC